MLQNCHLQNISTASHEKHLDAIRKVVGLSWKIAVFIRLWPLREKVAQIVQICSICQQKYTPAFADFLTSATADLLKSANRNTGTFTRKTFYPQG